MQVNTSNPASTAVQPTSVPALIINLGQVPENRNSIAAVDNGAFIESVIERPAKVHHLSRKHIVIPHSSERHDPFDAPKASLLIQALHGAFGEHYAFALSPELVWYAVMHEVATYVKSNKDRCAQFFTCKPGEQQLIEVRDDSLVYGQPNDWAATLGLFNKPIRQFIKPEVLDTFLPRISTMSIEDQTAVLVAFMDAVSPYYHYQVVTRCGIPRIRLTGTAEDWGLIESRLATLGAMFDGLKAYFTDLTGVVREIKQTVVSGQGDPEFWRSIYKFKDESGGPVVTGWITALMAYEFDYEGQHQLREEFGWRELAKGWGGFHTNGFPSHISRVPFVWDYHDIKYQMTFIAGVLGVEQEDAFVTPKLGFGVLEAA